MYRSKTKSTSDNRYKTQNGNHETAMITPTKIWLNTLFMAPSWKRLSIFASSILFILHHLTLKWKFCRTLVFPAFVRPQIKLGLFPNHFFHSLNIGFYNFCFAELCRIFKKKFKCNFVFSTLCFLCFLKKYGLVKPFRNKCRAGVNMASWCRNRNQNLWNSGGVWSPASQIKTGLFCFSACKTRLRIWSFFTSCVPNFERVLFINRSNKIFCNGL